MSIRERERDENYFKFLKHWFQIQINYVMFLSYTYARWWL